MEDVFNSNSPDEPTYSVWLDDSVYHDFYNLCIPVFYVRACQTNVVDSRNLPITLNYRRIAEMLGIPIADDNTFLWNEQPRMLPVAREYFIEAPLIYTQRIFQRLCDDATYRQQLLVTAQEQINLFLAEYPRGSLSSRTTITPDSQQQETWGWKSCAIL
jgi:hypothetical protein